MRMNWRRFFALSGLALWVGGTATLILGLFVIGSRVLGGGWPLFCCSRRCRYVRVFYSIRRHQVTDAIVTIALTRLIDLANLALAFYAIKRGFDYLTARLHRHGAEPIQLERQP